ncbi:MAG: cell surface protein SprA [Candidatus Cloacimonadia bacterium]
MQSKNSALWRVFWAISLCELFILHGLIVAKEPTTPISVPEKQDTSALKLLDHPDSINYFSTPNKENAEQSAPQEDFNVPEDRNDSVNSEFIPVDRDEISDSLAHPPEDTSPAADKDVMRLPESNALQDTLMPSVPVKPETIPIIDSDSLLPPPRKPPHTVHQEIISPSIPGLLSPSYQDDSLSALSDSIVPQAQMPSSPAEETKDVSLSKGKSYLHPVITDSSYKWTNSVWRFSTAPLPIFRGTDSLSVQSYLNSRALPPSKSPYYFLDVELYTWEEEFDIEENRVIITEKIYNTSTAPPSVFLADEYFDAKMKHNFHIVLSDAISKETQRGDEKREAGLVPDLEFPQINMPKGLQRFFGDSMGRLRVSGSQRIAFGGGTTSLGGGVYNESSSRGSSLNLKMEQELDLRIHGTIGEKIHVDIRQSPGSSSLFSSDNITIKYVGTEDDPIKLIETGNTSLRLTGSQFVSAPASSGDLFGVKGEFEFGKLKLTTIISQQEGQKATATARGSATESFTEYSDMEFARNKFFYIAHPDTLYTGETDNEGELIPQEGFLPAEGTEIYVYLDDGVIDNVTDMPGYGINDPDDYTYHFELLEQGTDYVIDYTNSPEIIMFTGRYIKDSDVIGIIYTARDGTQYGDSNYDPQDPDSKIAVKLIKKDYTEVTDENLDRAFWDYQLKNRYYLGAQNIPAEDFEVTIYKKLTSAGGEKEEYLSIVKPDGDTLHLTYAEFLGLDTNKDGLVDSRDVSVDLENGILTFPVTYLSDIDTLIFNPFSEANFLYRGAPADEGNDIIYKKIRSHLTPAEDVKYYLGVKMKSAGSRINLGYTNIIKGSEKVYVDGKLRDKGTDYDIDYISGVVTLKGQAAVNPNADVKIDFEYQPFFSIDKKNMFGIRADYEISDNAHIGSTIMYETESVREDRPKVGGEPNKLLVGDIDGELEAELPFITNAVNILPFVETNEASTLNLSGEVAMNFPTPNATDKKEGYLEDMETIKEAISFGISRTDWTFASYPVEIDTAITKRGVLQWYNPKEKFRARDVYPDISEDERDEYITVLEYKMLPPAEPASQWAGIMRSFGGALDFSEKEYLEIRFKSENTEIGDSLFIDFGFISEDFWPLHHPDGFLNKEDGIIYEDTELDIGEDIGIDRVTDAYEDGWGGALPSDGPTFRERLEQGLFEEINPDADPDDPNGDNYHYEADSDDYSKINGFEGNNSLDTEDLNGNGRLDTNNEYFRFAINPTNPDPDILISEYKGWKFLRIPLHDDSQYTQQGNPQLSLVKSARIWTKSNSNEGLLIDIVSCDVVGNKWKTSAIMDTTLTPIPSGELGPEEGFVLATDNNRDNPDYVPPPGSIDKTEEELLKEKEIEQSLYLNCKEIGMDRYLYARNRFIEDINALLYDKIKFWVYIQEEALGSQPLEDETIVFRIGADTLHYYEYRTSVPVYDMTEPMREDRWYEVEIDFTELTGLKNLETPDTTANARVIGNPSLSYVKELGVGLVRPADMETTFTGKVYFDDIRFANPYEETGVASRLSLGLGIADIADLDIDFTTKTANFYSLGNTQGSGSNTVSYSIHNTIHLNKFLPSAWGLDMPFNLHYSNSESDPRFQPNSDIEITSDEEKELYKTTRVEKIASISFDKRTSSSNPFVKYLIDNTDLSASITNNENLSPTRRDTTLSYRTSFNYNLRFSRDNSFDIFKNFKLFYLPQRISLGLDYDYSYSDTWKRSLTETDFIKETKNPTETLKPSLSMDYEIFSDFKTNYSLNTTRDLQKPSLWNDLNIGMETSRNQRFTINYSPAFLKFIGFSSNYRTNYGQSREERTINDTMRVTYNVDNDSKISSGISLRFKKWGSGLADIASTLLPEPTRGKQAEKGRLSDAPEHGLKPGTTEGGLIADAPEDLPEHEDIPDTSSVKPEQISPPDTLRDTVEPPDSILQDSTSEAVIPDTTQVPPSRGAPVRNILGRMGNILGKGISFLGTVDLDYSYNYKTRYKVSPDSLPDFFYQIGFNELDYGELRSFSDIYNFNITLNNGFNILPTLSATLSMKYHQNLTDANNSKSKKVDFILPRLGLTYSGIDKLLPEDIFSKSSLSSSFERTVNHSGSGFWTEPETSTTTLSFSPLISFSTTLYQKVTCRLSGSYSKNNTENFTGSKSKTKGNTFTIDLHLAYTFNKEQGISLPFIKDIDIRNELTTVLDISYNARGIYNYEASTEKWQPTTDTDAFDIKARASYKFSQDIRGGLTANYTKTNYTKYAGRSGTDETNIGLNLWVEFIF